MLLIADSGSTKTSWAFIENRENIIYFNTRGYNPYFVSSSFIEEDLKNNLPENINPAQIDRIFFFGAGCNTLEKKEVIKKLFEKIFCNSSIEVDTDAKGAAIALFKNSSGIACILGTGSNAVLYDGKEIFQYTAPLGYILGDEGSATDITKRFLKLYLRNDLPSDIKEFFDEKLNLSHSQIINNVYNEEFPNKFLASLALTIFEMKDKEVIKSILNNSIDDFFKAFVLKIPEYWQYKIGFCGSTAYFLEELLKTKTNQLNLKFHKCIRYPINELVKYFVEVYC